MNKIFVDTSGWIALGNRSDAHHTRAVKAYKKIGAENRLRVTTDAILIEMCNALRKPALRILALALTRNIREAERSGHIEVVHVTTRLINKGLRLFESREDKEWSLTDCISFVLMKEWGISEALTTDHHFEQAGFVRVLG